MKSISFLILILLVLSSQASFAQAPATTFADSLISAGEKRTRHHVVYDGSYQSLAYPGGDVADDRGVCTDVIIRCYRVLGIDLQKEVHEDMAGNFSAYPALWQLSRPDANIDHRRVPNLQCYFERQGSSLPVSTDADDFLPGDLVTWMLPGNLVQRSSANKTSNLLPAGRQCF